MTARDNLEKKVAEAIAEHVTIGYTLRPDGLVDPNTIQVASAVGAAYMAVHIVAQANGSTLMLSADT